MEITTELIDPASGECIDVAALDTDALITAYEAAKEAERRAVHFRQQLTAEIVARANGQPRLAGANRQVKIVPPARYFDQSKLRQVAASYPAYADEYLRVERYAVNLVPFKKLAGTTVSDPAFGTFQKMLLDAEKPTTAQAYVTVEK